MAFEELQAELALLLNQMENQPEDKHELYLMLREKVGEMRAFGMPLPDDLERLLAALEDEFARDAEGEGAGDGADGDGGE